MAPKCTELDTVSNGTKYILILYNLINCFAILFLKVLYIMSITDFFSSIFGKTNKTKRSRGKQSRRKNIKTRYNNKRKVRFMKGAMKGG